jgi:ATP-binding cassette subfamily B protein
LNIILFAIFFYVVYWTFKLRFTIGEMTLLLQLVQQARFPLFAMSFILSQIQQADSGSKDFFDIMTVKSAIKDKSGAKTLHIGNGVVKNPYIEFRDVSFRYDENKPVLTGISFKMKRGEKLALVGESGQGKSTLVNLLLRFYEPKRGAIYINGENTGDVTQASLRKSIAVVFQESLLFSGTVLENIIYGNPDAGMADVIKVAKAANAYDFIMELPDKFDSLIGERGVKLSGGQKQRISIARAMLKGAPIIILDEATSSLDSRSEIEVQQGLDRLTKNRTTIIIAHRLSTIAGADDVLVLSKGTVAQYGSAADLLKNKNGLYAKMIDLQHKLLSATPEEREEALKQYDLVA